jgi:hypothetical protein
MPKSSRAFFVYPKELLCLTKHVTKKRGADFQIAWEITCKV